MTKKITVTNVTNNKYGVDIINTSFFEKTQVEQLIEAVLADAPGTPWRNGKRCFIGVDIPINIDNPLDSDKFVDVCEKEILGMFDKELLKKEYEKFIKDQKRGD